MPCTCKWKAREPHARIARCNSNCCYPRFMHRVRVCVCCEAQAGGWAVPVGVDARQWYMRQAGVDDAWAITRDADLPTVVVAVVDGGFDTRHPDLAGALWVNPGEIPGNGIDDDGNGERWRLQGGGWYRCDWC